MSSDNVVFAYALYDFEAPRPDTLPFKKGDILHIVEQSPSGWWQASDATGKIGLVPKNYMELNTDVRETYPIVRALFDFESDKVGDLNFKEGDEIVLKKELSPDWWEGVHDSNGQTGVFPSSYVEKTDQVDYNTAEAEAAKWANLVQQASAEADSHAKARAAAEKELEEQQRALEKANAEAAEARAKLEAEAANARRAKREAEMQKAKEEEKLIAKKREEAELKHMETRKRVQSMKMDEETARKRAQAARDQEELRKKEAKKEAEEKDAIREPKGAMKRRQVNFKKKNKFAHLGGGDKCVKCTKTVGMAEKVKGPNDSIYHVNCFRCSTCEKLLTGGEWSENNAHVYCKVCYSRGFGPKGFGFGGSVTGDKLKGIGKDDLDRKVKKLSVDNSSVFASLQQPEKRR